MSCSKMSCGSPRPVGQTGVGRKNFTQQSGTLLSRLQGTFVLQQHNPTANTLPIDTNVQP